MLRSIRSRLLWAFLGSSLLLFAAAGVTGYALARRALEDELGRSLQAIAAASASQLSTERLLSIEPGDELTQTRTYRNLERQLLELREASAARRIFAVDRDGRVRVDTEHALPVGQPLPELLRDTLELQRVRAGETAASQVLFRGSDGLLYKTGYAPLRSGSEVVGFVGVEGSARFFGPLERLGGQFLAWGAVALLAIGLVALAMAKGLAAPLARLARAAERIGGGDLSTPVQPEQTREIGALARGLESMRTALESRDRQLQMMLAGVAHEVRNPLGGITLFTSLLADELGPKGDPAQAKAHLGRISAETAHLERIVEDFLVFARQNRVHREPINGAALLDRARELLRADAERRQIEVRLEAGEGAELEGDEGLLTAAVVNLLKNAIQASPEGELVTIRGAMRDGTFFVEVEDRGPGVPEAQRARIFEPFFTTREKGTGLGLPLARKIARAHGGELLLLESARGARFRLEVPRPPGGTQGDERTGDGDGGRQRGRTTGSLS